jgi:hypothetical protein
MMFLAACDGGGGDQNLGASTGNSLTSAEIDAALGPANQQGLVNSPIDDNQLAAANAVTTERKGNEAGLLRRHPAGNAAE